MHGRNRIALAATLLYLAPSTESLHGQNAGVALDGTQPLSIDQPLDEVMVSGISRFVLRQIEEAPRARQARWARDYSSLQAYDKSVESNRARFRTIVGAVDRHEGEHSNSKTLLPVPVRDRKRGFEPNGFEIIATLGGEGVVARSESFDVFAARWQVFPGVTAEGLLLQPRGTPIARVVVIPDADWTPEMVTGMVPGIGEHVPVAGRLAASGIQVVVPTLISRDDTHSGSPLVAYTNQPHREFIYRQAFQLGRHIIGYEVQKIEAAIDEFEQLNRSENVDLPIGVTGVGEGGLLAFYAAALDSRIDAALVSGYFQPRERVWEEPIYRNIWALLTEFGDAEIASLVAPRALVVEACAVPAVVGPPPAQEMRRNVAAPGKVTTCALAEVQREFERAKRHYNQLGISNQIVLAVSGDGTGPSDSGSGIDSFCEKLAINRDRLVSSVPLNLTAAQVNQEERQRRQVQELVDYTQRLMRLSEKVRDQFWSQADRSSVENWQRSTEFYRNYVWEEMIGKLPPPSMPINARTRHVLDDAAYTGYEVVLDVYPDVIAAGILLLPKDLRAGEKRPVVVCQHGLEGTPMDTITSTGDGFRPYQAFAANLAKRGFIVYAPQNPYRGEDRFRVIQRQANPLKLSLFSFILRQHERTLEWLRTLPHVDPERIGFYGLSYGGKTAMRVPPLLPNGYAVCICSADFNEWIRKVVSVDDKYGYVFTPEYEMPEWNMGHVANYAELASLFAPRPFMVERGHDDGVAPDEWVAAEFAKVRRHYVKLGVGARTEIEFFDGPHQIHGAGTFEFLHRHLDWQAHPNR
jgi:dienelactone hydrolase